MFKELIGLFWILYFRFQDFEKQEIEKINCYWGQDKEHTGLVDTSELNEGLDWGENEGVLHAKLFKRLKDAEDRLDLLYQMEEILNKAIVIKRQDAKDELSIGGSIRPETENDGKKTSSLLAMIEGQIGYWESVHKGLLAEDEADPDTFTTSDGGYNQIHWGKVIATGEKLIDKALKCNDIEKIFDSLKKVDELREKRHLTYKHWLKIRWIANCQIMRNATSENMRNKAMHFAIMSKVNLAKKEAEDAKAQEKLIPEREPLMMELHDACGSYSINIEDAIDKYHAVKKLADKNGVDCREMCDMLDEEDEPKSWVKSVLTDVVDVLKACGGVKAQAARKLGLSKHKFQKLLESAINTSKLLA